MTQDYVGKAHTLPCMAQTDKLLLYKHSFNVQSHREACSLWELMVLVQSDMPHFASSQLQ